jgi:hypothetical protein
LPPSIRIREGKKNKSKSQNPFLDEQPQFTKKKKKQKYDLIEQYPQGDKPKKKKKQPQVLSTSMNDL